MNPAIFSKEAYSLSDLSEIYPQSLSTTLTISYRSSYEIIQFAKQFIAEPEEIEAVERHGKEPKVYELASLQAMGTKLGEMITDFKTKHYQTLSIIVNNQQERLKIEHLLKGFDYTVYDQQVNHRATGIILTTIQFAKGLEFDEVLLPTVTPKEMTQQSKGMYVKATRALHELNIFVLKSE